VPRRLRHRSRRRFEVSKPLRKPAFEEDAFIRLDREGRELQRIDVPGRRALACVLGGRERRTLYCLSAATSYAELRQRKSSSRIDVVEVEVAGAGNP
jgi:sugar lactone lactonase YvrE